MNLISWLAEISKTRRNRAARRRVSLASRGSGSVQVSLLVQTESLEQRLCPSGGSVAILGSGSNSITVTSSSPITITGSGSGSLSITSTGSITITGSGSESISSSGTSLVSGAVTVSGSVSGSATVTGSGTLKLTGSGSILVSPSNGVTQTGSGLIVPPGFPFVDFAPPVAKAGRTATVIELSSQQKPPSEGSLVISGLNAADTTAVGNEVLQTDARLKTLDQTISLDQEGYIVAWYISHKLSDNVTPDIVRLKTPQAEDNLAAGVAATEKTLANGLASKNPKVRINTAVQVEAWASRVQDELEDKVESIAVVKALGLLTPDEQTVLDGDAVVIQRELSTLTSLEQKAQTILGANPPG